VFTHKGGRVSLEQHGVWAAILRHHKTVRHGEERCLFFGPEAQKILGPKIDGDNPLFVNGRGNLIHHNSLYQLVRFRQCNHGLTRWPVYSLRHTCAQRVSRDPRFGLEGAGAYQGHKPKGMTSHYAGAIWEKAAMVAAAMG
jgi:integrase